ncbi:anti-phage ZorAB system protein ZorA [Desulfobacter latus]|uniref:Anti-phage defense ZorAB system ZorA n=1 Tax=Desulfobacter latus TaxID=2292 RepID=A0A850T4N4_9BACT|nr:anti-phage ZorAB system protein ZorA [Desulfobacter latus]NWH06733.1 anti-phage defense ZorAB system ZorA [Desulfobacter latus]
MKDAENLTESFSFTKLWPEFSAIIDGRFSTNVGASALVVCILFTVFGIGLLYVGIRCFISWRKTNFFIKLLKNIQAEDLSKKRKDILHNAQKKKEYGKLWGEFDETLILSPDGTQLYNTIDASHFFNTSTLAPEITENRLLTAVPAFLTAIGVIGTFAGLQMGLSGLSLSKDVGVDVLRDGIGHLINGASIAFLTSVWGVFASLVFNFLEKLSEKFIRDRIRRLQERIDTLFVRANPEEALVKISDYSRHSTEVLQGLAEKIGDKMQEAVVDVSNTIQGGLRDSLNDILAPAIQSLITNSNKGVETAMDALLERFIDKMGAHGEGQRDMLNAASKDVNQAVGSFSEQMHEFLQKLEKQQNQFNQQSLQNAKEIKETIGLSNRQSQEAINQTVEAAAQKNKELTETFEKQQNAFQKMGEQHAANIKATIESTSRESQQAIALTVKTAAKTNTELAEGFQDQLASQKKRDEKRDEVFRVQAEELQATSQNLMSQLNSMLEAQKGVSKTIINQCNTLMRDMERVTLANKEAAGSMSYATQDLKNVGKDFKDVSTTMESVGRVLNGTISKAIEKAEKLTELNQTTTTQVGGLTESITQIKSGITEVTDKLVAITDQADKSFDKMKKHQEAFQTALAAQIKDLETDIIRIISDYGQRVNNQTIERLREWNTQTSQYTSTMTDAISSLSTVVDEIEAKMSPV